jgi:hypothetical protein
VTPTDAAPTEEAEHELPGEAVHPEVPLTQGERDLVRWLVREEIRRWTQQNE